MVRLGVVALAFPSVPPPATAYPAPSLAPREGVNWLLAIAYGLPVAVLGGAVWGAIAAFSGFIFGIVAIVLGLLIAFAVRKGGGKVTAGTIVAAAVLTIASVFVGQLVTIAILIADLGGTFIDAIAIYPEVVAAAPGDIAISFLFGLFGVGAAARYLWRELRVHRVPAQPVPYPVPTRPTSVAPAGMAPTAEAVSVRVLERARTRAAADVFIPGPQPHSLHVEYENMLGTAMVALDGVAVSKVRVWGRQKEVEVPLSGQPLRMVKVRFFGTFTPQIDVSLDGALVAQI